MRWSPLGDFFKSSMFMVPAADTTKPCFHPFCCAHLRVLLHQSFQARKALAILTLVEDHVVAHCPEVCGANTPQQHKPFPPPANRLPEDFVRLFGDRHAGRTVLGAFPCGWNALLPEQQPQDIEK